MGKDGPKTRGEKAAGHREGPVQSLTRALSLLEQLSLSGLGLTLTDAAAAVGLPPSTAHRLLNSLRASGYTECDDESGLWSVGLSAFTVGNAYLKHRDFITRARPVMKWLVAQTGETANLAVLVDCEAVFVAQVECTEVMRMVAQLGSRSPVHASGVGKALLAALPEDEAIGLAAAAGMPALTDKTMTTKNALKKELASIRAKGYAVDDEEQKSGLRCIAANVYDHHGEALAAISISGPTVRVEPGRIPDLAALVVEAAQRIAAQIGGESG